MTNINIQTVQNRIQQRLTKYQEIDPMDIMTLMSYSDNIKEDLSSTFKDINVYFRTLEVRISKLEASENELPAVSK